MWRRTSMLVVVVCLVVIVGIWFVAGDPGPVPTG